MVLGAVMLITPLIITTNVDSILIFVPMISLLLLLFGFPIILRGNKYKNIETWEVFTFTIETYFKYIK